MSDKLAGRRIDSIRPNGRDHMPKIVKRNIAQQVFAYLKEKIEDGTWPVGSRIPSENELTESLGVSRSSVRTAIQQCVALNILESQHGRGTFVRNNDVSGIIGTVHTLSGTDYDDLLQVLQFRMIVEKESAALAAKKAAPQHIERLEKLLDTMKANIGNADNFVPADVEFHRELCRAAGNTLLEAALCNVFEQTARSHRQLNDLFGYKDGIYYHTKILKAVREGNEAQARREMKEHLQQAIDNLMQDEEVDEGH